MVFIAQWEIIYTILRKENAANQYAIPKGMVIATMNISDVRLTGKGGQRVKRQVTTSLGCTEITKVPGLTTLTSSNAAKWPQVKY